MLTYREAHLPRMLLPGILLLIVLVCGCVGTTNVPLDYSVIAGPKEDCSLSLAVAQFKDARGNAQGIGRTEAGRTFYPDRLVEDWVTQSLISELESAGCRVSRAEEPGEAPEFTLQGRVDAAWLTQLSSAEYRVKLHVYLQITKKGRQIHAESFRTSLKRTVFPSSGVPQKLVREALQDTMRVLVPKALEVCRGAGTSS